MSKATYRAAPRFQEIATGLADPVKAASFPKHVLRWRNDRSAASLGLDGLSDADWIDHFGRFKPLADNMDTPLAQRYHGHQFRVYNPDIGDGRGFLFAQMLGADNRMMDLTTKGSGQTPYSRSGDGRLTLKGAVREIMASEMLWALGANTSDTLSVIETGEQLIRHDEPSPARSAVLVRRMHGSVRIGSFQRQAYFSDHQALMLLVDYCLETFFGITPAGDNAARALTFLEHVTHTTAKNAADLMAAGYVHGVLNSDNINITGEIFDFGPWRLLPTMDLNFTAAYFDETGLYRFGRQPDAILWDLYQLGGALADIAAEDDLKAVLEPWGSYYVMALQAKLLKRLGVKSRRAKEDATTLQQLNDFLTTEKMPFERFFFDWYGGKKAVETLDHSPEKYRYENETYSDLFMALKAYEPLAHVDRTQPYFRSGQPCSFLIDEVEAVWSPIHTDDDWTLFQQKMAQIKSMADAHGIS